MGSGASISEQLQNASQARAIDRRASGWEEEIQEALAKMPEEEQEKIKSCLSPEDQAKAPRIDL